MEKEVNKKEEVSFTKTVKEEVSLYEERTPNQFKVLLSAFIKINGHLVLRNNEWIIVIKSENIKTAKMILKHLKLLYDVETRVAISEKRRLRVSGDNKIVNIEVSHNAKEVLEDLQIYNESQGFEGLPTSQFLGEAELKKAYLAGAFLASGSVNSPVTKNYHLEIAVNGKYYGDYIIRLLKRFYLDGKQIQRRNQTIVYLKKSEQIGDFLKILGAWQSLLKFEEIRIQRDQFNSLNRIYNCEISNEKKAMEIGNKQAESISWYQQNIGLEHLPEALKVVAEVRLANPEGTYLELAEECHENFGVQISKPGFSYRMQKLLDEIAKVRGEH